MPETTKNDESSKSQTSRRIKNNKMINMQKVMVQYEFPEMTSKQYDQVSQDLSASGDENPKGWNIMCASMMARI